jgi:hypothetical protein
MRAGRHRTFPRSWLVAHGDRAGRWVLMTGRAAVGRAQRAEMARLVGYLCSGVGSGIELLWR